MATQTMVQENTLALTGMVRQWDRRLRLRQTLLWLPRSLMPGVAVGLLLAIISRLRPFLLPQQIALITLVLVALGAAAFALAVWLWRRSTLTPLPLTSALTPLPPSPVEPGEGGLSRERQQIRHCFLAFRWERTSWR